MLVNIGKLVAEFGYHNPDPLVCLLGHANETACGRWGGDDSTGGYWILPLRNLIRGVLHLKGMGGISIPNKGYVEANLTIPDLP